MTHIELAAVYTVGYVVFAVTAVCVWAFVYRPRARTYSGGTWSNEEIVKYAMAQAVLWPVMAVLYIVGLLIVGLAWVVIYGLDLFANRVAKALPQGEDYHSGFRRKRSERERVW